MKKELFKLIKSLIPVVVFFVLLFVLYKWVRPEINDTAWYKWFYENAIYPSMKALKELFSSPILYIAITVLLVLERIMPAKPNQKIFSVGFAQDTVWFILDACFQVTILTALTAFWISFYKTHLSFLTITAIQEWPMWARFLLGVLIADFAGWLHHYARHKIPFLWQLHAVHHSQKELNMFTDVRYHIFEYMITNVTNAFFISIFTTSPYAVAYYGLFHSWWTKMCHSNIKADLGWIKYIMITPQSHRVHHSIETRHHDKNMGIMLSIWDYMFGVQYRKYDEYPDTGIQDEHFPHEEATGLKLLWVPIKQHLYPLKNIFLMMIGRYKG